MFLKTLVALERAGLGLALVALKRTGCDVSQVECQAGNITANVTRRPASAERTVRHQFQAVFPVITGSFPTNVIAHLHGLSMDLTVGKLPVITGKTA